MAGKKLTPTNKSKATKKKKSLKEVADEVGEHLKQPAQKITTPIDTKFIVSSGSTLLDLEISGGRVRGGGIPGGIMMEIFGPSSSGKTALLMDIAGSVQNREGTVTIKDPEARLDREYSKIFGVNIKKENYSRPNTVTEIFEAIDTWVTKDPKVMHMMAVDSTAALSTNLELSDKKDKRGQRKAKELSEGCRVTARKIAENNKLVVFTNQEKQSEYGKTTPGGLAVGFHSSLRLRTNRIKIIMPEKTLTSGVVVSQATGILSSAFVHKSSIDQPFGTAPIYIMFGVGIDDIRANLQWYKDMLKLPKYLAVDKEYQQMNAAITWIENNNLEGDLREMVINLWEEIRAKFKMDRKKKVRF